MRERGIIFSGESVRAILEGQKTQTRRVIKGIDANEFPYCGSFDTKDGLPFITFSDYPGDQAIDRISAQCPFGLPGDRLFVKETLKPSRSGVTTYAEDGCPVWRDGESVSWPWPKAKTVTQGCPRWASRLTVENTGIKAERLQDISEEDAKAEGVDISFLRNGLYWQGGHQLIDERNPNFNKDKAITGARGAFAMLWDSLNAKRAPWSSNPWVFAISFRKVDL